MNLVHTMKFSFRLPQNNGLMSLLPVGVQFHPFPTNRINDIQREKIFLIRQIS